MTCLTPDIFFISSVEICSGSPFKSRSTTVDYWFAAKLETVFVPKILLANSLTFVTLSLFPGIL